MRAATATASFVLCLAAAAAAHPPGARPAADLGRCETTFVFTGPTSLEIASVCQIRGVGRVTGVSQQELAFTDTGMHITNTTTYTTPSGDELYAAFSGDGTLDGAAVHFTGIETYTGGTGRLAEASGSATLTGSASLITQTGSYVTSGTLAR